MLLRSYNALINTTNNLDNQENLLIVWSNQGLTVDLQAVDLQAYISQINENDNAKAY